MITLQKPSLTATILTVLGVGILCALGTWQINRLAWKTDLIATYERAMQSNVPITLDDLNDETPIIGGTIKGFFIGVPPIVIAPRTLDGDIGKHIYVPFGLENGESIFINMGWAPHNWNESTFSRNQAPTILNGMIKPAIKPSTFTPDNAPPNQWYWPDLKAMAKQSSITNTITTHYFVAYNPMGNSDIIPIDALSAINNNHRQYAFFWFTMAGVLIVIFTLRFIVTFKSTTS